MQFAICNSLLLSFLVAPAPLGAQDPEGPLFVSHPADGAAATGPLEHLGEGWSVSLGGPNPAKVGPGDLIALRRAETPLPGPPSGPHVVFTNGDQLPGTVQELQGERLRFRPALAPERPMNLPLSALTVVWLTAPGEGEEAEALRRHLAADHRRRDVVLLRNGDRIEGTLTTLTRERVGVEGDRRQPLAVDRNKVAAVALSTELARPLRPRGPYGRVVLADGGRLSLASAQADAHSLTGKTLFGAAVEVPVERIIALDVRQGRAVYLSDLKPRRYEHTPYLDVRWPYVPDGSAAGGPLRLGGSTYDKGLGLHSASRLTYDLGGRYQWFEALVGLDDRTGRQGSVRLAVLVDGRPQAVGGDRELTGGGTPQPIRMSVAGARELTLVVEFGRRGDVQDHVDWTDARLIK